MNCCTILTFCFSFKISKSKLKTGWFPGWNIAKKPLPNACYLMGHGLKLNVSHHHTVLLSFDAIKWNTVKPCDWHLRPSKNWPGTLLDHMWLHKPFPWYLGIILKCSDVVLSQFFTSRGKTRPFLSASVCPLAVSAGGPQSPPPSWCPGGPSCRSEDGGRNQ